MTICDFNPIMLIVEISKKLHLIDGRKELVFKYILKNRFMHCFLSKVELNIRPKFLCKIFYLFQKEIYE